MNLSRFSIGIGDRFGHQGRAQLRALQTARDAGVEIVPVWNKSHREHTIIGSLPADTRTAADAAVKAADWKPPYHVDADHISLKTVDAFLEASDFFTLDVADFIGKPAPADAAQALLALRSDLLGSHPVPGLPEPIQIDRHRLEAAASKTLLAVMEAARLYRHIEQRKGAGTFITEVSMDECDLPQTPQDLLLVLAWLAHFHIPVQTIAPKFSGRFNKGVDYVGDPVTFAREFEQDIAVVAYAVKTFGLPPSLKLSVHSGSDKFSLYGPIGNALRKTGAGLHLKTAGTTWLEEIVGLAEAGGDGLELAREIYRTAYEHRAELCAPYATVIDIDASKLPAPGTVEAWPAKRLAAAVRHVPTHPDFNPNIRQLLHVGYKVAAQMGSRYLDALNRHEESVARNVEQNLWERHLRPIFVP